MPCDQVQVNQGQVFTEPFGTLVEPHGPHGDKASGVANIAGCQLDLLERNVADTGSILQRGAEHF